MQSMIGWSYFGPGEIALIQRWLDTCWGGKAFLVSLIHVPVNKYGPQHFLVKCRLRSSRPGTKLKYCSDGRKHRIGCTQLVYGSDSKLELINYHLQTVSAWCVRDECNWHDRRGLWLMWNPLWKGLVLSCTVTCILMGNSREMQNAWRPCERGFLLLEPVLEN